MKFDWVLTGSDKNDLKCIIGEDMLRVERMDKGVWWFAVHIKGDERELMSGVWFPAQSTKEAAKMLSEAIYILIKKSI